MAAIGIVEAIPMELQVFSSNEVQICTANAFGVDANHPIALRHLVVHTTILCTSSPEETILAKAQWVL